MIYKICVKRNLFSGEDYFDSPIERREYYLINGRYFYLKHREGKTSRLVEFTNYVNFTLGLGEGGNISIKKLSEGKERTVILRKMDNIDYLRNSKKSRASFYL